MSEVGIQPTPAPDVQGALSQVSSTTPGVLKDLETHQAQLEGSNQDLAEIPAWEQTPQGQNKPQINPNGVMSTMPMLIGLAALAGKVAGIHPKIMLNSVNGMTKGLIQGNQQAYADQKAKYDDSYQKYMDKYKQQFQIYKEMQQVYKGQVNADLKALEIALRATGYEGKITMEEVRQFQHAQEITIKLHTAEENKRHHMATEENAAAAVAARGPGGTKAPTGYEWDPGNPGELRPIKGGPKDSEAPAPMGSREAVFTNRMITSGNLAIKAATNLMQLPIKASSGLFGSAQSGHTLMTAPRSALANKMTSEEDQLYKVMVSGLKRNLASMEAVGLMPSGSLTDQMAPIEATPGQERITRLSQMAEMRQIVEASLEPIESNPRVPEKQKQFVKKMIGDIQKAIPFTQEDVIELEASANPSATVMDFANSTGLGSGVTVGSMLNGKRITQIGTSASTGKQFAKLEDGSVANIP